MLANAHGKHKNVKCIVLVIDCLNDIEEISTNQVTVIMASTYLLHCKPFSLIRSVVQQSHSVYSVLFRVFHDNLRRAVCGPVVDHNDFPRECPRCSATAMEIFNGRIQTVAETLCLVERRKYQRDGLGGFVPNRRKGAARGLR